MTIKQIKSLVRELVGLYVISGLGYIALEIREDYHLLDDKKFLVDFFSIIAFLVVPAIYLVSKKQIDEWLESKSIPTLSIIFLLILLLISFTLSLKTYAPLK